VRNAAVCKVQLLLTAIALTAAAALPAAEAPDLSGAELFRQFCATCHGSSARGDGPVAPALKHTVPDLTRIAARSGGTFPTDRVRRLIDGQESLTAHGTREMPVWGWEWYAYKGEDEARRKRVAEMVEKLVNYLGTIQRG
jgi:mono/diheme cytochrome c family protein